MKESIIIEVAKLMINISLKKMTKNQKILSILNKVNKLTLRKDDFEAIYVHSLVEYGVDKADKDLVRYFSSLTISKAIKKEIHTNDVKEFIKVCELVFDDFKGLENFSEFDLLNDEIKEFHQTYDYIVSQTVTPFTLKKYNEDKKFQNEMIATIYKNSFEYQSEKYLKYLIKEFKKEFPGKKYIEQKGETREIIINLAKDISNLIKKRKKKYPKNMQYKNRSLNLSKLGIDILDFKDVEVNTIDPIDKYINDWINDDSQNFLVIMGEYGTGKTALCKYIASELANSYFDNETKINDENNRIVIFLNLRNFKAEDVEKYIIAELNENGIKNFNKPDLYNRIDNKEIIFLFDGFDEMTQRIDTEEKKANFLQIEKLIRKRKNSKVILTSREEYFTFEEELNEVFKNKENENYKIIYLNLFDEEQIKLYLESHTDNAQYYLDKIKEIYDLSDLAQRPILLDFIVKYLPKLIEEKGVEISINASDLYQIGIQTELEKKSREVSFLSKKLPTQKRLLLLQKLSVWMFENDSLTINTRIIKEELNLKEFFEVKEDYELIKYLNMFLNFTFLTKESDYTFRISHKSFRDYLTATELVKEIHSGNINVFGKHQTSSEITHFISEMNPDRKILEKLSKTGEEITEQNKWQKSNAINLILKIDNPLYNYSLDFNCKHIIAPKNNLTNITILREVDSLIELGLDNSSIKNVKPLIGMKKLSHLYLNDNQIFDIEQLKELKDLNKLYLYDNQISDILPLRELKQLTSLNIHSNQISDITPLYELTKLTELNLAKNQFCDISPLQEMKNLTSLYLHKNQISNIIPLQVLTNLTSLHLSNNQINDISPLQELINLTSLALDNNQINDIAPLQVLNNLELLMLENNYIIGIDCLINLKNLTGLYLKSNRITDLNPLAGMKKILVSSQSSIDG